MANNAVGKISQVIGAVVDVQFEGEIPAIQNALEVAVGDQTGVVTFVSELSRCQFLTFFHIKAVSR